MANKLIPPGYADFVVGAELTRAGLQFIDELVRKIEGAQTHQIYRNIPTAADQDYIVILKAERAMKILETTSKCRSGTATATFKINSTALGGTANAVSSAEQSQAHATLNQMVAGDDLIITISANAACLDAAFAVKFTATPSFV
jgi:hypothetical protein